MGERLERSPTSIAPEAPSTVSGRVGLKFSPQFSPEELFGPEWLVIAQAETPEDEAQKPAVLNKNHLQRAQEAVAGQFKKYAQSIQNPQPMDLLEGVEIANVLFKVTRGAGLADAPSFLLATALIELVRLAYSNPNSENSSKLSIFIKAAKNFLIHQAEHEVAGKVAEKGIEMVSGLVGKKE